MHKEFNAQEIEKKWQQQWEKDGLYEVGERDDDKEKEYVLVEWPYPSGNLHIGHWYAFAVPDIYVRYRRMQGKQVLFPMGFDAFGLPAENAAIKHNINPRQWTEQNIEHMKAQLHSMGAAFSWDKTTSSIDPDYYAWTQWMFTRFYEEGLAYRGTGVVNWCPGCNTVIANEQVATKDGVSVCERCSSAIEKKDMPQWMLRITQYADRLIDDLEELDWPEYVKEAQRQWIGRSSGAEIDFLLSSGQSITCFTTRPDTLYGATYLVLAPEHQIVASISDAQPNAAEINTYVARATATHEQDRLDATRQKTGVRLGDITATNPMTGKEIPVFIADYVLAGYGTGAIMAVPAHDERDHEFAVAHDLPITPVVTAPDAPTASVPFVERGVLINSGPHTDMDSEAAANSIVEAVAGRWTNTYRLRDWSIGRQRYWGVPIPIVYDPEGAAHVVPAEHLPWTLPEDVDFTPTGEPPLAKSKELFARTEAMFGAGWVPEVETMDTFVDSSWYFLRYIDAQNSKHVSSKDAQNTWMPVDIYLGGAEHTTMHLLYSRFWQKALYDIGVAEHSEPYKKRINRGLINGPDGEKMSKSKGNVIDPDEQVRLVGADTVKMYLAFLGPYQGGNYPWDPGGVVGIRRFLERVNGLSEHITDTSTAATQQKLHQTTAKLTEDIPLYKFNTAISALMTCLTTLEKQGLTEADYKHFLRLLAPFAAHLAEELWYQIGERTSIHSMEFPTYDAALLEADTVTIGVQVNGKLRGSITISPTASEAEALAAVTADDGLRSKVGDIAKVIYRPGKILNLIVNK